MTIATIELRIESIKNEMLQLKNSYSKLEGHLAEAMHWLTELNKTENEIVNINDQSPQENPEV